MQEISPTLIPGRRQRHETPTRAMTSCHATRTWRDVTQRFSRQIKWTVCIGFSVDFTLSVLLAFRNNLRYVIC
jgi:hypothetical protein